MAPNLTAISFKISCTRQVRLRLWIFAVLSGSDREILANTTYLGNKARSNNILWLSPGSLYPVCRQGYTGGYRPAAISNKIKITPTNQAWESGASWKGQDIIDLFGRPRPQAGKN
jgi:hypothetical protein